MRPVLGAGGTMTKTRAPGPTVRMVLSRAEFEIHPGFGAGHARLRSEAAAGTAPINACGRQESARPRLPITFLGWSDGALALG